jgi:hypothetical protein
VASGQYFHQDLLVAQLIYRAGARRHVDVGSRVDGFIAHVAVFCEVEVLDIRPIQSRARNINFRAVDIMKQDAGLYDYTDSLSCLHALEHFGLGRYGDPIDYNGHRQGFATLARMVRVGGVFYFSVPISERQRFEFNAHRIFSIPYLLEMFDECGFEVKGFHYVDDAGDLHESQNHQSEAANNSFGLSHGCGIFEIRKRVDRMTGSAHPGGDRAEMSTAGFAISGGLPLMLAASFVRTLAGLAMLAYRRIMVPRPSDLADMARQLPAARRGGP